MTGPFLAGDPAPKVLTRADRVLVAATTAFLFVAPAAASTGWRLLALSLAGLAILALGWPRLREDLRALPAGLLLAFATWATLAALSYSWSAAPHYSLGEIKTEIGYGTLAFAVFLVTAHRYDRWALWRRTIFAGAIAVFVVTFIQDLLPFRINRQPMDGGPGPWSTHLVMVAPFLLAISWPRPWGRGRHGAWTVLALGLLALAAWRSENRIVWAAFGVQLMLVAFLMRAGGPALEASSRRARRLLLAGVALALVFFGASVVERSEKLFGHGAGSAESLEHDLRPQLWSVAAEELRKAPWLGHGFGREIRGAQFLAITPDGDHPATRHAHNVFIDMALQVGLLGLAAFAWVLLALAIEYARYLREPRLAPWGIVGLALLAGFLTKNLTDDFMFRHNALLFWALNALLVGCARRERDALR